MNYKVVCMIMNKKKKSFFFFSKKWSGVVMGVKFVNLKGRYLQVQWDGYLWLRNKNGVRGRGYVWAKSVCLCRSCLPFLDLDT